MKEIPIKNIKPFKQKSLPIVEVFGNTLQGEGPRLRPAIFVRTGLCNFKCEGFGCTREAPNGQVITGCDTIHAVSPKFKERWTEYTDFKDLKVRIDSILEDMAKNYAKPILPDIIVTGGEPTMHWDTQAFQDLLKEYVTRGHSVTMETNASKFIQFTEEYQNKVTFSMSVKLSVSGEPERKRLNFEAIQNMIDFGNQSYLKFVVNPETWESTKEEIFNILSNVSDVDVYLMPLGETIQKQLKNIRFVFDQCSKYGFFLSPRAHILAFDDLDGV